MADDKEFINSSAMGDKAIAFVKQLLELSDYEVCNFGIEHHNKKIISSLKNSYAYISNKKLHGLPDLVVIDKQTKRAYLVEVKFRGDISCFNIKSKAIQSMIRFWPDAFIVIVSFQQPYCLAFKVNELEDIIGIGTKDAKGYNITRYDMLGIEFGKDFNKIFSHVKDEDIQQCLKFHNFI